MKVTWSLLATFPDSGRVVPELGRQDIRGIIVRPYRVMYRRTDDRVEIAAVRHEARKFDEKELKP
ncbi:MAG: type II toxin-antitoxin system RelE/ParE family toxin [Thermoleophilia bacterium]